MKKRKLRVTKNPRSPQPCDVCMEEALYVLWYGKSPLLGLCDAHRIQLVRLLLLSDPQIGWCDECSIAAAHDIERGALDTARAFIQDLQPCPHDEDCTCAECETLRVIESALMGGELKTPADKACEVFNCPTMKSACDLLARYTKGPDAAEVKEALVKEFASLDKEHLDS